MRFLEDIIQRCHQRHEKPLRQKKTIVRPSSYKGLFYHFTVYCAQRYPVKLYDLEQAGISFMPVGGGLGQERVPQFFGGERFLRRQRVEDWKIRHWHTSWGLQVYTGVPSEHEGARWHDLAFTYQAICAAPEAVLACIETLVNVVGNPLLTLTKNGGLRFSCRVPDYLHGKTPEEQLYVYKDSLTPEKTHRRDVYLEILGAEGHSSWDARYELVLGDLLEPPVIPEGVLFTAIDKFRSQLHDPNPSLTERLQPTSQVAIASLPSLGSYKLDLAKEAFLKRKFLYIREENDLHLWSADDSKDKTADVALWERDDTIWVRAATSGLGIPRQDTLITDVWDDTGILPPIASGLRVSDEVIAVREGKLSPLAIKRPLPVLQKPEDTQKVYEPLEKSINQIKRVFETHTRVVGLHAETDIRSNYEIESYLLKNGTIGYSAGFHRVEEGVKHFQRENVGSLARWRNVLFRWNQVKEIAADVRMATPFERGNVCEDPERFVALAEKGVDPTETLCPQCQVYTACQKRGYLSQPRSLQTAKIQLFGFNQTFFDPQELSMSEKILEPINDTQRLCIVSSMKADSLFLGCSISKQRLEEWHLSWQGYALGNFAAALMNILDIDNEPDDFAVRRIRTLVGVFEQHEAEIVRQMCQINVQCEVVKRVVIDEETGEELARFAIAFDAGSFAYIPHDSSAADKLTAKGLQVFALESFALDEQTSIPMSIQQAIKFNILDMTTLEKLQAFPRVYHNPDWTFWHQLKRFLTHYPRDADAPMIWYDECLHFWVPPVLHSGVKKLLFMSATLSKEQLYKAFPNEDAEFIHVNPTPWAAGNQLFQIQTGIHTSKTLLDYNNTWDVIGLSKMGERFFLGIGAEIQRDPNVKHAIITDVLAIRQLKEVANMPNVCLMTEYKDLHNLESAFQEADVIWIVGTPYCEPGIIWRRAQILYGNDEVPLSYEAETEFQHYKDERVQRIYTQTIAELITEILGRAGFNRWGGKKVVLISSLEIPDITDREETLLFDWEDFQVAGALEKLPQTIATRHRFQAEQEQITANTSRQEIERILGCSSRQANRMLNKLRGGNIPHVTIREQILACLADGEKKAADMIQTIDGNAVSIYQELRRLDGIGEIVKVRWGVYTLPDTDANS